MMRIYQIENLGRVVRPLCVGPAAAGVAIRSLPLMGLGALNPSLRTFPRRQRPQLRGWFDDMFGSDEEPIKAESWGKENTEAFQEEYDEQVERLGDDAEKAGGARVVYDVQVRLVERGGKLSKYGVDGKWGTESQAAWDSVMGVPITRAAVSKLVGYEYTGAMSVFGVSEGGGGGGVTPPVSPPVEPPAKKETDWTTYLLIGAGALAVGTVAYTTVAYTLTKKRGR